MSPSKGKLPRIHPRVPALQATNVNQKMVVPVFTLPVSLALPLLGLAAAAPLSHGNPFAATTNAATLNATMLTSVARNSGSVCTGSQAVQEEEFVVLEFILE
jgi:hypothetical protein